MSARAPGWAIRELEARVDVPEDTTPAPSMGVVAILLAVVAAATALLVALPFTGVVQ